MKINKQILKQIILEEIENFDLDEIAISNSDPDMPRQQKPDRQKMVAQAKSATSAAKLGSDIQTGTTSQELSTVDALDAIKAILVQRGNQYDPAANTLIRKALQTLQAKQKSPAGKE